MLYPCVVSIVTAQLPGNNGYSGGKVVFIDTEVCVQPLLTYSMYNTC